jgi:hypothetical protein
MLDTRLTPTRRILIWIVLLALAGLIAYVGIRGYLSPELLFHFSSSFNC